MANRIAQAGTRSLGALAMAGALAGCSFPHAPALPAGFPTGTLSPLPQVTDAKPPAVSVTITAIRGQRPTCEVKGTGKAGDQVEINMDGNAQVSFKVPAIPDFAEPTPRTAMITERLAVVGRRGTYRIIVNPPASEACEFVIRRKR